jgi:hypothetical protein
MTDKKSDKSTEKKEITNEELEKMEILRKADKNKGEQIALTPDGRFESKKEIQDFAVGDIDDPDKKHDVYYKGIQKLLIRELPSGNSYKSARDLIYDEKNILITRGAKKDDQGIRGADSRMGFITDMEVALDIITNWIVERGTMYELYEKLRKKNTKLGYHNGTKKEDEL